MYYSWPTATYASLVAMKGGNITWIRYARKKIYFLALRIELTKIQ
jgi:hypothetical protein